METSDVSFNSPSSSATLGAPFNNTFQTKQNLFLLTLLYYVLNFLLNQI